MRDDSSSNTSPAEPSTQFSGPNKSTAHSEASARIFPTRYDSILFQLAQGLSSLGQEVSAIRLCIEQQTTILERALVEIHEDLQWKEAARDQHEITKKLAYDLNQIRSGVENIRTVQMAPVYSQIVAGLQERQLGYLETMAEITNSGLSFARYGDGELRMMTRLDYRLPFQRNSPELMHGLKETLAAPIDGLLIGMPHMYRDTHWAGVFAEVWGAVAPLLETHDRFGNSHVSRPAMFRMFGQPAVEAWRRVWSDRSILIITGKGSRFEMNEDLFATRKGHRFIYTEPKDAFEHLHSLENQILESAEESDLVLISLGPAGTVLAARLARQGLQSLDIGHLSSSYETAFNGGKFPEHTPVIKG